MNGMTCGHEGVDLWSIKHAIEIRTVMGRFWVLGVASSLLGLLSTCIQKTSTCNTGWGRSLREAYSRNPLNQGVFSALIPQKINPEDTEVFLFSLKHLTMGECRVELQGFRGNGPIRQLLMAHYLSPCTSFQSPFTMWNVTNFLSHLSCSSTASTRDGGHYQDFGYSVCG